MEEATATSAYAVIKDQLFSTSGACPEVDEMRAELITCWEQDDRVKCLKLIIQVSIHVAL